MIKANVENRETIRKPTQLRAKKINIYIYSEMRKCNMTLLIHSSNDTEQLRKLFFKIFLQTSN